MRNCFSIRLSTLFAIIFSIALLGCATSPKKQSTTAGEDVFANQQLSAIEAFIDEQQSDQARIIINTLNYNQLSIAQQTRYVRAQSNIALLLGNGQEALSWLSGEYAYLFDGLPLEDQIDISLSRSFAFELSGKPLSAARERIFLSPVLEGGQAENNHEQIWFNLQLVSKEQLMALAERESSPDLTGWINLALLRYKQSNNISELLSAIETWQNDHPIHPAAVSLPKSLQILKQLSINTPKNIGVLLPLSGALKNAGDAIRNGLLTAWYEAKNTNQDIPQLRFYDTAETEDILTLYKKAVSDGAELIIGPLSKTKVQRLAEANNIDTPVLALNYADTGADKIVNFYQFGLAPEDEAIQVAEDIWKQGIRSVLIIAPDTQWGDRVSDAFIQHWELKGGIISSKASFERPDQYLEKIKTALNIRDSETRHFLLEQKLNTQLEYEFRRRQDIDMIFMLAFPTQARQLKPILNYQRAADIPIVATSSIYSGTNDREKDRDIEDIRFVEMPWRLTPSVLKNSVTDAFPQSLANYSALIALGVDSYRLHTRLPQMSVFADVRLPGATGIMKMNDLGRIERELEWATFKNGLIQRAPIMDEME